MTTFRPRGFVVPLVIFSALLIRPEISLGLPFIAQAMFGGAGDETGTGVATTSSGVYFSGYTSADEGIVGEFAPSLASPPVWSRSWPGVAGQDSFAGVTATGSSVYAAGLSYSQTIDTRGGKERKGITVKFNSDGSAGPSTAGAVWAQQTPGAPGGFPYGGIENLTDISSATESGQNYIYTAGIGERVGFTNLWGAFVSKLDEAGNVIWSRNDMTPTQYPTEPAVASDGNGVYLATRNDSSGAKPYLKSYDTSGTLDWSRTSAVTGEYRGIAVSGSEIVVVGQSFVGLGNSDFLIEKWDTFGNLLWSKTFERSLAENILHSLLVEDGHIYAVGSTTGATAGGIDGILLDIDFITGDLLDTTLWGGSEDDLFKDLAVLNEQLFAVGSTRSYGSGGSDIALVSFALPSQGVPEPGSLLLLMVGLMALVGRKAVSSEMH